MAGTDLEPREKEQPDFIAPEDRIELNDRQVQALDKLAELGAAPRQTATEPYSKDPKIRAYQMVFEDKIGGNRGGGRPRAPRASELIAEHIRKTLAPKMKRVLEEALDDENVKVRLQAFELARKVEMDEAKQQLEEDKVDDNNLTRDALIGELIELVSDSQTGAALEAAIDSSATEITEAEVVSNGDGAAADEPKRRAPRARAAARTSEAGTNGRSSGRNGTRRTARDRRSSPNPLTQAALRRAAD